MKSSYERPRINNGDLRTPVSFWEYKANGGPEPGEKQQQVLYKTYAKIDEVWSKDVEQAKANDTLSDITLTIRDPHGDFIPTNKHYIDVDYAQYSGKHYNIKQAQPDPQNRDFIKIIAGRVSN